jgi:predicted double-glycine peptidase
MLQGMTINELIPILRKTTKKFGLKYERLNYERKGRFIKLAKHSDPVIVGIIGNNKIWGEDGHWTVIRKVTNKKVKIQDSSIYAREIPRKRFPQFEQAEVVRVYKP